MVEQLEEHHQPEGNHITVDGQKVPWNRALALEQWRKEQLNKQEKEKVNKK